MAWHRWDDLHPWGILSAPNGSDLTRDLSYSVLNAVGASFLVVSLLFDFNLSALMVESFWALISAIGIIRCLRSRLVTHATFQRSVTETGEAEARRRL